MPIKPGATVADVEGIYILRFGNLETKWDPMVRPGSMDRYASTIGKVHHGAAGTKRLSQAVFFCNFAFSNPIFVRASVPQSLYIFMFSKTW